jgi:hypothetical protein
MLEEVGLDSLTIILLGILLALAYKKKTGITGGTRK